MIPDDILLWYSHGRFDAGDMSRGTGLSERSQRTLAKLGILLPIPQERSTAPRLFDARMFKRAALIAPLKNIGLSLEVAGTIIYAAPSLERFIFSQLDPWRHFFWRRPNARIGAAADPSRLWEILRPEMV